MKKRKQESDIEKEYFERLYMTKITANMIYQQRLLKRFGKKKNYQAYIG